MSIPPFHHTFSFDDGERQQIILALAHLAVERPGWDFACAEIAKRMDNALPNGRPQMFEEFKRMFDPTKVILPADPMPAQESEKFIIPIGGRSIICKTCRRQSYNLNDVREKYCGFCHAFHEQAPPAS